MESGWLIHPSDTLLVTFASRTRKMVNTIMPDENATCSPAWEQELNKAEQKKASMFLAMFVWLNNSSPRSTYASDKA